VSYLLARAADTIADVEARPSGERLALLDAFRTAVHQGPDAAFLASAASFAAEVEHAGEQELLKRLGECFVQLGRLTQGSQEKVRTVLGHILHGMSLDLRRFPDPLTLRCLKTAEELDEYTWLVAGCVGEFWTAICAAELPGVFTRMEPEMTTLGGRFGKGLQLINILRDQAGDAAIGRCYLPGDRLREAGLSGEVVWPAADWRPWHTVRRNLTAQAREFLEDGWTYAASQRSIRLRFATLMPLLIGGGTLSRMEALPEDRPPAAVKVTRQEVKRYARRALWMALTGRIKP
jgi:farnesyl-diphosphate farnesyltransferase